MSVRRIKAGTTDVSVVIRIIDSSDGTPETGVVFNTSGIDLWYRREGAASVDITEADLSTPALTDAHADGGFLHINDGWYRLDLPDAACAAGVTGVQIGGTVTGMVVLAPYIELVAYDPYDTVRLGLTALPNAAADAAGGLPISDAGGLDLDAILADTNELQSDDYPTTLAAILADTNELQTDDIPGTLATIAGYLDTEIAAILADTNELQGDWTNGGRLDLIIDAILADTGTDGVVVASGSKAGYSLAADQSGVTVGTVNALGAQAKADVNAEAVDALATDTYAEPSQGAPGATLSIAAKLGYLYTAWRNKKDNDGSTTNLYADDGSTVLAKQGTSEDSGTVEKAEWITGA